VGELSLLVDAGWRRRGLGTFLLGRLRKWAGRHDLAALVAHVRSDDVAMLRTLAGSFSGADSGMVDVTLAVTADALSGDGAVLNAGG